MTTASDWKSKVLGSGDYKGVLPHDQVPFVNRHSEVFDLFHANVDVILKSLACRCKKVHIRDWRPCSVAVAVLGKLTADDWKKELARAQSAASWYYNLNGCESMYDVGIRPVFVHFDEIGDLQENVKELREEEHIQSIVNTAISADTKLLCPSVAEIHGLSAA
ncbi:hypothetical protein AK812_SmicGene45436 [Symbiodinium microadriaticum]|uniref:Uncharacterized protein n=1 Tax=Symbiodinium microadriaticum TaxID=2951 RepID=A0A1Q9BW03_SYMMI|nr:hypothetical protein AK812_SmicGene45436 [Symbiodinium microadriaticum]